MSDSEKIIQEFTSGEYKEGFVTDVEQEFVPKGLNEDIIRTISRLKDEPEWLLEFRLDAFRKWQAMEMPRWPTLAGAMDKDKKAEGSLVHFVLAERIGSVLIRDLSVAEALKALTL